MPNAVAGPGRLPHQSPTQKAVGAVLSLKTGTPFEPARRESRASLPHLLSRPLFGESKPAEILRRELRAQVRPKTVDAEAPEIVVEIAQPG